MRRERAEHNGYQLCAITPCNAPHINISGVEMSAEGYRQCIKLIRQNHAVIATYTPNYRAPKLVVFDLDGTLVEGEFMTHLAETSLDDAKGTELRRLTEEALEGGKEWGKNYATRVALLKGMELEELEERYRELPIVAGAKEMIKALQSEGTHFAIITGAWNRYAQEVAEQVGIAHCYATEWEIEGSRVTGKLRGKPLDPTEKLSALCQLMESLQVTSEEVAVVGDGYNDIEMMKVGGCSIFLHATPDNPLPLIEVVRELLTNEFN